MKDPVIVINADANAPHQSVISVMEAARIAGYGKITFTTQAAQVVVLDAYRGNGVAPH